MSNLQLPIVSKGAYHVPGTVWYPFRNALPHIAPDRNVLPLSAAHVLLVKSELVRQFHKNCEKFVLFRHFKVSFRVEKKLALYCTDIYENSSLAFLIKPVLKIWFIKKFHKKYDIFKLQTTITF